MIEIAKQQKYASLSLIAALTVRAIIVMSVNRAYLQNVFAWSADLCIAAYVFWGTRHTDKLLLQSLMGLFVALSVSSLMFVVRIMILSIQGTKTYHHNMKTLDWDTCVTSETFITSVVGVVSAVCLYASYMHLRDRKGYRGISDIGHELEELKENVQHQSVQVTVEKHETTNKN
jgi:hypothetical protein